MFEQFSEIIVPLLGGVYVVLLCIFYRVGDIRDLLKEIRDIIKKEVL